MVTQCSVLVGLLLAAAVCHGTSNENALVADWNFEQHNSLFGWDALTTQEMETEVSYYGDMLYGEIIGKHPHIQSPPLHIVVDDKHLVVVRMKYHGQATQVGGVTVNMGSAANNDNPSRLIPFTDAVRPDGLFHTYFAPVYTVVRGSISFLRVYPVADEHSQSALGRNNFAIAWIKVIKAPTITKVEGCINKYFSVPPHDVPTDTRADGYFVDRLAPDGNVSAVAAPHAVNGDFAVNRTIHSEMDEFPIAMTYNCPPRGGSVITIKGRNFGDFSPAWAGEFPTISIGGKPCTNIVVLQPDAAYRCQLPAIETVVGESTPEALDRQSVMVRNRDYTQLFDAKPYLAYMVPPAGLADSAVRVTNVAARSVDLEWSLADVQVWDAFTITGFVIQSRTVDHRGETSDWDHDHIVSNVTTTTVVNLEPTTTYEFRIAPMAEVQHWVASARSSTPQWLDVDLYASRSLSTTADGSIGVFTNATEQVTTLERDMQFPTFDAKSTFATGASHNASSMGLSNNAHGEGHYGLVFVGHASLENCNASHACCDAFDGDTAACSVTCTTLSALGADWVEQNVDGNANTTLDANVGVHENGIVIGTNEYVDVVNDKVRVLSPCGSAVRLTAAHAQMTGAVWYPRQLNVREGFETRFTFRISEQSDTCRIMDDVKTKCRARGGDGFAFVIQTMGQQAIGTGGKGLGYAGINDALAVEFDTFYNPDLLDPYENHISVTCGGRGGSVSSHHQHELASTGSSSDLSQGSHDVRITYEPSFDESVVVDERFIVGSQLEKLVGGWNQFGLLKVYIDDVDVPLFMTLVDMDNALDLDSGRAWVGFTGATGDSTFQVHDLLSWDFVSLRQHV